MKALYYDGKYVCDENVPHDHFVARYEEVSGRDYDSDVERYMEENYSAFEIADYTIDEMCEEYDEELWDEGIAYNGKFTVRIIPEDTPKDVSRSTEAPAKPHKWAYIDEMKKRGLVPSWAPYGVVGDKSGDGSCFEIHYEPITKDGEYLTKPACLTKGCKWCNGRLNILGKVEGEGWMPTKYLCVCDGPRKHCEDVAEGEYGEIIYPDEQ